MSGKKKSKLRELIDVSTFKPFRSVKNKSGNPSRSNELRAQIYSESQSGTQPNPVPSKSKASEETAGASYPSILVHTAHSLPLKHDEISDTNARQADAYVQLEREDDADNLVAMSRASTWNTPYDSFEGKIMKEMAKFRIGLNSSKNFLPDNSIKNLVTQENITSIWGATNPEFVSFIISKAPKTFLITIRAMPDPQRALLAMQTFMRHNFTDIECLPVENLLLSLDVGDSHCARYWSDSGEDITCQTCTPSILEDSSTSPGNRQLCVHQARLNVFHHGFWTRATFRNFYDEQWYFLVKIVDFRQFLYRSVETDRILPLITSERNDKTEGGGNFGEVAHAYMLASHFTGAESWFENALPVRIETGSSSESQKCYEVAIKTLVEKLDDKSYKIEEEWQNETRAYRDLNALKNNHIVKGLAAYKQHGKFRLLLEWADGGNLKTFWKKYPEPDCTAENVLALLHQLQGLARALNDMHNTAIARSRRNSQTSSLNSFTSVTTQVRDFQPPVTPSSTSADSTSGAGNPPLPIIAITGIDEPDLFTGDKMNKDSRSGDDKRAIYNGGLLPHDTSQHRDNAQENWRHGDIKPENLLRFQEASSWLGTWKVADLGRAKHNMQKTNVRRIIEVDKWHTKTYEPPDIYIHGETRSMSRLYDVWSLGCVFFEALVWLLYGRQALHEFEATTEKTHSEGTPYWSRKGNGAILSEMLGIWTRDMLHSDAECSKESALRDVLSLIKDQMLVIPLPPDSDIYTSGCRANAKFLSEKLENIVEKAKENPRYLFTGSDRSQRRPPLRGVKAIKAIEKINSESFLQPNLSGGSRASVTENRKDRYTQKITPDWSVCADDKFSLPVFELFREDDEAQKIFDIADATLCNVCSKIDLGHLDKLPPRTVSQFELSDRCDLCAILYRCTQRIGLLDSDVVQLDSRKGRLEIVVTGSIRGSLRLCRTPDSRKNKILKQLKIPVGIPCLPDRDEQAHTLLIRSWLSDCDKHNCRPDKSQSYCPRRLLSIGRASRPHCKLIDTMGRKIPKYIALSHPWGNGTQFRHFTSTRANVAQYKIAIPEAELPQNFLDAVYVARELEIPYLWIDSLCILQKDGDDKGDFALEADRVADIYSSAYCVLAASSAKGMTSGFLRRSCVGSAAVQLPMPGDKAEPDCCLYASELLDDFENDVMKGVLNQRDRGWVLQEHALAYRTIFFTDNQTYWECADGIRCETMTKIKSDKAAFLGDSNFPSYAVKDKRLGDQLELFSSLYEDYSMLGFSYPADKPVAIAGIEQRLTEVFEGRSGAGVFQGHRERWLLWTRADTVSTLEPIAFHEEDEVKSTMHSPPTWSWMSYVGGITYMRPPGKKLRWNPRIALELTGTKDKSWLKAEKKLSLQVPVVAFNVPADASTHDFNLIYDCPGKFDNEAKLCVVVGSMKVGPFADSDRHYVLLARRKPTPLAAGVCYERIGAGYLADRFLGSEEDNGSMQTLE